MYCLEIGNIISKGSIIIDHNTNEMILLVCDVAVIEYRDHCIGSDGAMKIYHKGILLRVEDNHINFKSTFYMCSLILEVGHFDVFPESISPWK
jgi:hypothetical protein